jgi:tRNA threonylcarbamoyladenosine biosynthesis protein TsaB
MNLLAIETSSPFLSVAVKKGAGKIRHASVKGYMKHAENLLPVIDRLLRKEKLKIKDIDAFLIGRGPGSFTGLRIGFATLKGFLATQPKPCYGALSVDLIAAGINTLQRPANLAVCLDAKRGKLYTRSYRYHKNGWVPAGPACVVLFKDMSRKLSQGSRVAGDGITKFDTQGLAVVPEKNGVPQAATLIELFEMKSPFLKKLARPKDFLPVYLRSSEPEERLKETRQHSSRH